VAILIIGVPIVAILVAAVVLYLVAIGKICAKGKAKHANKVEGAPQVEEEGAQQHQIEANNEHHSLIENDQE